jgi:SAM-dependent methyltransferase
MRPASRIEIFGFDVNDHGVQAKGFLDTTTAALGAVAPEVDWSRRIHSIRLKEEWPFEAGFFDFVVSNQVLEHVADKPRFFQNVYRCLKVGGYSFNLNPLVHCVHEGHIWLPFAHRIRSYDLLYSYIRACSRLGLGKFPSHARNSGMSLDEYTRRHADYMLFWTSYASQAETLEAARNCGLRGDFRFTREFFGLKFRQIFRVALPRSYKVARSALADAAWIRLLRYLSSVTLVLQKNNEYVQAGPPTGH